MCVCWVSSTYAHSQPRPFCFVPRCCAPVVLCSRGLLNDTCKALLQEARRRGLVAPPSNTEVCQLSLCMSEPVCLYLSVSVCPPPSSPPRSLQKQIVQELLETFDVEYLGAGQMDGMPCSLFPACPLPITVGPLAATLARFVLVHQFLFLFLFLFLRDACPTAPRPSPHSNPRLRRRICK